MRHAVLTRRQVTVKLMFVQAQMAGGAFLTVTDCDLGRSSSRLVPCIGGVVWPQQGAPADTGVRLTLSPSIVPHTPCASSQTLIFLTPYLPLLSLSVRQCDHRREERQPIAALLSTNRRLLYAVAAQLHLRKTGV